MPNQALQAMRYRARLSLRVSLSWRNHASDGWRCLNQRQKDPPRVP